MGSWGTGYYDNDDAADWAGDLDETEDKAAYAAHTLTSVLHDNDPASYDTARAIASAAWVASYFDPTLDLDDNYGPQTKPVNLPKELADIAVATLNHACAPGLDWYDSWVADKYRKHAIAGIETLKAALKPVTV